jgi:DNA processing protein
MDQNRLSLLALHFVPGIGDYLIRQLVSYCGSAEKIFSTPKGKLLKIPGVGEATTKSLISGKAFEIAEKEIDKANRADVDLVFYTDKKYPTRLKEINDAPTLLYCKGNINLEHQKIVALIGTRNATEYGKQQVEELVKGLVPHQPLIISGLAYGIDIHAHKAALKHKLPTVGIMGSGIDVIYPAMHRETATKMLEAGGLITENPFGTKPDAHNFPARNRIIAGLTDALIVVEAAQKGGALITAQIANSYNKDVFAVPGNNGSSFSEGCNNLIKSNRAHLLTSIKDVEYIMNWEAGTTTKKKITIGLDQFEPEEQPVIELMLDKPEGVKIDELSWRSNIAVGQLASILLNLEFKGAVKSFPGKVYKLIQN